MDSASALSQHSEIVPVRLLDVLAGKAPNKNHGATLHGDGGFLSFYVVQTCLRGGYKSEQFSFEGLP